MSKRNRERRQQRRQQRKPGVPEREVVERGVPERQFAEAAAFLRSFEKTVKLPQPATWPGACDASLERPDLIKQELAEFAMSGDPGRGKCRQLERDLVNGIIHEMPELHHWGMEEFFWHGLPGDPWHPIEAFLSRERERFSPAACDQLRRWKEARIGFFEVGLVNDDRVTLREWDPVEDEACGPDFQAISLNIAGVNFYRDRQDEVSLTYVSPWAPEAGLMCSMGYGLILAPADAAYYLPLMGLRRPEVVVRPVPWKASPAARYDYARIWRQRAWHDWLAEHLEFPFPVLMNLPPGAIEVREANSLVKSTPEDVRDFGIYLEVDLGRSEVGAIGVTAVLPCDPTSPNALPLAEYRAYRDLVGLPRAVKEGPLGLELRHPDEL